MIKLLPTIGYSPCADCSTVFRTNKTTAILTSMSYRGIVKQEVVCDPCYNKSKRLGV